jgi:hypothetical protein
LLNRKARVLEARVDDEVWEGLLLHGSLRGHSGVSSTKDHPERLVIAYADENCQRDVIAAPSIIGPGFESREERDGEPSRQHAEPHCFETIASPQGDV